jgi:hypothetical protein
MTADDVYRVFSHVSSVSYDDAAQFIQGGDYIRKLESQKEETRKRTVVTEEERQRIHKAVEEKVKKMGNDFKKVFAELKEIARVMAQKKGTGYEVRLE